MSPVDVRPSAQKQIPVTPDKLAAQAQTYRQMLKVCLAAPNCKAFIVFGIYDAESAAQDPR